MDFDTMTYADLRRLAKSVGLKANMKAEKLLQALKLHFEQESSVNGNSVTSDDGPVPEKAAAEPEPAVDALVTTRRRKKQQAKRKYSGDPCDPNPANPEQSLDQDDAQQTTDEVEGSKRSSKRRKVSSAKDAEASASEEKPETADDEEIPEERQKDAVKKPVGKIPRHEGLMKKKAALRPTTPNFKKLHEAHFSKMESIDSYVQRKNKQMKVLRKSVKDLKAQAEITIPKSADSKIQAKPPVSRAQLFSPGVLEKKVQRVKVAQAPASKSMPKDNAPFRPSILSANRINVRFSQATLDNEHKRSLVKTPARMSPMPPLTPTPGRKSEVQANKKPTSVNKTPGAMPFIFSGSCSTPTSNKNTFDLKASLSRPLTYKPHKGKLKPFGTIQENGTQVNQSQTLPTRTNYKQHKVQTRDERRAKHVDDRKQKKEKLLGARRGLVPA